VRTQKVDVYRKVTERQMALVELPHVEYTVWS